MKRLSVNLALSVALINSITIPKVLMAQDVTSRHQTFRGRYDPGYPYPVVLGKPGQKDQTALREIRESATACSPLEWPGIEATGIITTGNKKNPHQGTGSLVVEKDNRLRFDMQSPAGTTSVRVHQWAGEVKNDNGIIQMLLGVQLGEYFVLPSQLWETANKPGVSVIDNGIVTINDVSMHAITIVNSTQFQNGSIASDFYFDPKTHYLLKSVFAGHYPKDKTHGYIRVISYSDYRTVEGAAVPHSYSETNDGQLTLTFQVRNVAVSAGHDKAYFYF